MGQNILLLGGNILSFGWEVPTGNILLLVRKFLSWLEHSSFGLEHSYFNLKILTLSLNILLLGQNMLPFGPEYSSFELHVVINLHHVFVVLHVVMDLHRYSGSAPSM